MKTSQDGKTILGPDTHPTPQTARRAGSALLAGPGELLDSLV
jgi:hypothetical protein